MQVYIYIYIYIYIYTLSSDILQLYHLSILLGNNISLDMTIVLTGIFCKFHIFKYKICYGENTRTIFID